MKIILGRQIEEIKKKDSENEKNLLKNRNSVDVNELYEDDVYFHSNAVKNIKLGTKLVNRIYLNHSIVYDLEDTILLDSFHSLVPNTATEIKFLYASNNPDLTNYHKIGYCDVNNFIEIWNSGTKYIIINPSKNYIYAPVSCSNFLSRYNVLTNCIFDNFDTRNTTSMGNMFYNCSRLTRLDLSNFKTDNVTSMGGMFNGCTALTNLDLSNFNTQNVKSMYAMFNICRRIVKIISNNFNKEALSEDSLMFLDCNSLVGGNGTTYSGSHVTSEYARVDGENGLPGYFTAPAANNNK